MLTFMVTCGFSLFDLRKLYLDELFEYNAELVYILEQKKELPEGTYDKMKVKESNKHDPQSEVRNLRRQLFKVVAPHKKP